MSNWNKTYLGKILCIGNGKDYKHLNGGNVPVFGTGGYMCSVDRSLYSGESVFIGRKGTIDKPFYYNGVFWTVDTLFYTHGYKETTAKFVYFLFQTINWLKYNEASGVPSLSKTTIEKIKISLPPLPEQHRIVTVLETWDKVIDLLQKKIELKRQVKKGLMQKLLTGEVRLPGFSGEWKVVKLGDVSDFYNGYAFKSSTYVESGTHKIVTISSVQDGYMVAKDCNTIDVLPSDLRPHQKLNIGDILISMTGNVGRICKVDTINCLLNQRVGKIAPTKIDTNLLFYILYTRKFLYTMIDRAQGGAQGNISVSDINNYEFLIPENKDEQQAIASVLIAADKEITLLEQKLSEIQKQKKFLLTNLVTGAIRTPENMATYSKQ